jgi:glycosyltransferase involved in cell wall biosynthesis
MKIAIYTIAKNEQQHVDRWAKSNQEADFRLVCDTGSTDQTVEKLKEYQVNVIPISVNPWRFDVARNTVLNLLPADIDICIWQDLDEELLPGWRQELEKHWEQDTAIANHKYRYNNGAWQWHSKIHARHNCHWVGPVHETLKWSIPEKSIWLPELFLDEHQDVHKSRSMYLNLLLQKIKEGDHNWRTYYFLANDYQNVNANESIKYRIESYNACDKNDHLVRSYVSRNIARQFLDHNQNEEAEKWFLISINHSKERESLFYYADFLYKQEKWDECYIAIKKCISVNIKRDGFTFDSNAWSFIVYDYAAISAYNIGLYKQAAEYGEEASKLQPNDIRLENNLKFYRAKYEQS